MASKRMGMSSEELAGVTMQDFDDMCNLWADRWESGKAVRATQADIDMLYPV